MRYKNQNIAVLGAGLSGSAAALLLISEGAQVTVLDSAEEKNLLKSTIDNLRAQNVRVICGAAADAAATTYHMAVLSPGIDPASRLVRNFSSRGIDIISELELGWRFCDKIPVIAVTGTITFSAYANGGDFRLSEGAILYGDESVLRLANTKLRGLHNIENLMATLAVGMARGLSFEQMVPPLSAYEPRPHRCEFVREVNGVAYVNDSKATNLDAVDKALRAQTKPVILIAGGKDKGFSFDPLRSLVKEKVKSTILIGEIADSIKRSWADAVESEIASSLADAVERAHSSAKPGEMVLFSPGTSSFDMFKSYADRGDQFRALVRALPET